MEHLALVCCGVFFGFILGILVVGLCWASGEEGSHGPARASASGVESVRR